jgi:putative ABC transport system permease protein
VSALTVIRTASGGIFRHKVQAFVLCAVLLISTASATLGLALLQASNGPYDHAFASQNGAHVTLTLHAGQVSAAQLAATAHAAGVTATAGPFGVVGVPVDFQGQPWDTLAFAGRSTPDTPVDTLVMTGGHWATGPGQMVMEGNPADFQGGGGPAIGDTFQATTLPGKPVLTIVGFASSITRSAAAWVTPAQEATLQALAAKAAPAGGAPGTGPAPAGHGGPGGLLAPAGAAEQMLYRFSGAATSAQLRADVKAITAGIPPAAIAGTGNWLAQQQNAGGESAIMEPFIVAFALIGLIMAVLIVFNVVSGAVIAQYHRIGVLKSLGMTPGQVVGVYLNRIGWPALAGCVACVALGNVLAIPVLRKPAGAYDVGQQSVPWWASAAAPLGMLALTMAAASGPALRAGRLSATQATAAGRAPAAGRGYLMHRLASKAHTAHTGIPASFSDVFGLAKLALLSLAALAIAVAGALLPASRAARARPAVALRAE